MKTGPDLVRDGLVFGYDTHDYSRFYNGPATTNHLIALNTSFSNTINTNGKAVAGTEEVYIPTIGKRTVKYVEYFNNYNNGNDLGCCPNLFNYHGSTTVSLVGNQSYTYSIVYKHTGGYTHPNFMYRYRYKEDGTYIGEGGLHSTARRTHLGDGWYHAWGSWTTHADANYGRFYSFLYNYGTTVHRFYVAAISLVKNNSGSTHFIIPPNLLLEPNTSVTSTQSLIDLKRTTDIDIEDVSFNSTGQLTFDGTDDVIEISDPNVSSSTGFSIEMIIKPNNASSSPMVITPNSAGIDHFVRFNSNGRLYMRMVVAADSTVQDFTTTTSLSSTDYHHITFTFKQSEGGKAYYNSSLETSASANFTAQNWSSVWRIGQRGNNTFFFNGELPILKIHNKVLSSAEVEQNFNAYKNRFEL